MRIKIGDDWYDSKDVAICVQVSEGEQQQIADMDRAVAPDGKYAVFPADWGGAEEMREWMKG